MNTGVASTVGRSTVSESDFAFTTMKQLRVIKLKKANYLSYFLSNQSSLIIKGIWPVLDTRAAGIVIMTASDGVQGLMALASLGQPSLS